MDFSYIGLTEAFRNRYGLPDRSYPIPTYLFDEDSGRDDPPLDVLLFGLQERSREDAEKWKDYERPIDRLTKLIAKEERCTDLAVTGNGWWLEIGPVDLNGTIVTIQRNNELVVALSRRSDGRLRVSAFRALDAKSLGYLASLGQVPHPETGVCMRENNWEYALDSSATMGMHYAAEAGDAYLSFWEKGIGISSDGTEVELFRACKDLVARRPEWVAVELAVHDLYTL